MNTSSRKRVRDSDTLPSATDDVKEKNSNVTSKPKTAKKSAKVVKVDEFKEFSANAAKQLKAHCGAGRLDKASAMLQKHGYKRGCISESFPAEDCAPPNTELLLDCAQNAARMGHRDEQTAVIDMLLDLGIMPDFTFMYWVTKCCCLPTLKRCAAICKEHNLQRSPVTGEGGGGGGGGSLLSSVAPFALQSQLAENFLHLMEECDAQLPIFLPSMNGFISVFQQDSEVYPDVNSGEGESGELLERVRIAVWKAWMAAGSIDDAVTESRRLQHIAEEHSPGEGARYEAAIHLLLSMGNTDSVAT
mmetsp:Transcript_2443/g.4448  ORF Transcript_2443/g.4448 Transcript_2443/m.4448 type:complete len:303 (+) Transcript_2443:87-995(+)